MMRILFAVLITLLVIPRIIFLSEVPYSLSHDEVEYAMSSLSYAVRGTDTSGVGFPRSLFVTFTEGVISPLVPIVLAPWYLLMGISGWSVHLPYVVLNLVTGWLLYILGTKLTSSKAVGFATAFVFLTSPWGFYYARYGVDSPFALALAVAAIYWFLYGKRYRVIGVALLLTLMFYSYHAAKLIYIPLIVLLSGWHFWSSGKRYQLSEYFWHLVISIAVFLTYYAVSLALPDSMIKVREAHTFLLTSPEVSESARIMRERTLAMTPINQLMINNVTVGFSVMLGKYLHAFSPDVLLVNGDMRAAYRFYEYGLLTIILGIFVVIGAFEMYRRERKHLVLIAGMALIAPLPTALSTVEVSVMHRAFLLLVVCAIVGGYGLTQITKIVSDMLAGIGPLFRRNKSLWGNTFVYGVGLVWFFFFVHFYFMSYGFRYPSGVQTFERTVGYYVRLASAQKVEIVAPEQRSLFFAVMANQSRQDQVAMLRTVEPTNFDTKKEFSFKNITVTSECPKVRDEETTYLVHHDFLNCGLADEGKAIQDPRDGAPMYRIFSDRLCTGMELKQWRAPSHLSDFEYGRMDLQRFCMRWVNQR